MQGVQNVWLPVYTHFAQCLCPSAKARLPLPQNSVSYQSEAPGEMLMWCQPPLLIKFLFHQAPIP